MQAEKEININAQDKDHPAGGSAFSPERRPYGDFHFEATPHAVIVMTKEGDDPEEAYQQALQEQREQREWAFDEVKRPEHLGHLIRKQAERDKKRMRPVGLIEERIARKTIRINEFRLYNREYAKIVPDRIEAELDTWLQKHVGETVEGEEHWDEDTLQIHELSLVLGYKLGFFRGITEADREFENVLALWLRAGWIKLATFIQLVIKLNNFKSHKKAVEYVADKYGMNERTKKVYLSAEFQLRLKEKRRSQRKKRARLRLR